MEWCKSPTGFDIIVIDDATYASFGKDVDIKTVRFCYKSSFGRKNKTVEIHLPSVPMEVQKCFGKKNIKRLRAMFRERIVGDILPRAKLIEVGELLNHEKEATG